MSTHRAAELRCPGAVRTPVPPLLVALLAHVIALGAVSLMPVLGVALPLSAVALLAGMSAAAVGQLLGLPVWWAPINLLFIPLTLLVLAHPVAPWWYLGAFAMLALVFRSTFRTRIPLYLSSRDACDALLGLVPPGHARVLDVGCGFGGVLARAAAARPDAQFTGIELAPLPALAAWLRLRRIQNVRTVNGDFWKHDLSSYDVVYAFLSPVAMQPLWQKARIQMKPGSVLISNSFAVEGVPPDRIIALPDRHSRALYVWRM